MMAQDTRSVQKKTETKSADNKTTRRRDTSEDAESDTRVPGRYCKLYLDPRGTVLRDPQMLLSEVERGDEVTVNFLLTCMLRSLSNQTAGTVSSSMLQPSNAVTETQFVPIDSFLIPVQPINAFSPKLVTLEGIDRSVIEVQPLNASEPIVSRAELNSISSKEEQPLKAY